MIVLEHMDFALQEGGKASLWLVCSCCISNLLFISEASPNDIFVVLKFAQLCQHISVSDVDNSKLTGVWMAWHFVSCLKALTPMLILQLHLHPITSHFMEACHLTTPPPLFTHE